MQAARTLRAGIYARISKDDDHQQVGVNRQEQDGRRDLEERGIELHRPYVDNDLSASGDVERPDYLNLVDDLRNGAINAVWAWDIDRLQRGLREFNDFVEVCQDVKARVIWPDGEADFRTGRGIDELERRALDARTELRKIKRRTARGVASVRDGGHWRGGPAPYGYSCITNPDGPVNATGAPRALLEVEPAEAEVLREAARRALVGESLGSICTDLNGRGVPSKGGGHWSPTVLGRVLASAAISGRIEHRDPEDGQLKIVGEATWEPIIPPAASDTLRRMRAGRATRTQRRSHLLAGLAVCGRCGAPLMTGTRRGRQILSCRLRFNKHDHGCGGVTIAEQPVEDIVVDEVVTRIDSGGLTAVLHAGEAEEISAARRELEQVQDELQEVTRAWYARELGPEEYDGARQGLRQRRNRLQAVVDTAQRSQSLPQLPSPLEGAWDTLSLPQQRATLKAVLAAVTIMPAARLGRTFDPDRVRLSWRE